MNRDPSFLAFNCSTFNASVCNSGFPDVLGLEFKSVLVSKANDEDLGKLQPQKRYLEDHSFPLLPCLLVVVLWYVLMAWFKCQLSRVDTGAYVNKFTSQCWYPIYKNKTNLTWWWTDLQHFFQSKWDEIMALSESWKVTFPASRTKSVPKGTFQSIDLLCEPQVKHMNIRNKIGNESLLKRSWIWM